MYMLPPAHQEAGGGGGGGEMSKLPAPKGRLPKVSMQQITPPRDRRTERASQARSRAYGGSSSQGSDRFRNGAASGGPRCSHNAKSCFLEWNWQWGRHRLGIGRRGRQRLRPRYWRRPRRRDRGRRVSCRRGSACPPNRSRRQIPNTQRKGSAPGKV